MRRMVVLGAMAVTIAGCDAVKQAFSGRVDVAASADGDVLSVDRLAEWAGRGKQIPLQHEALYRLTKVWVDYTLFARAVVSGRALDDSASVAEAMWPMFSQLKWERFQSRLVSPRDFTPQQVDSAYAAGTHRLFQHILIMVPPNAPPDVEAEKRRAIDGLRRDIVARQGKNFTELATSHSEDPGSKQQGGFLGISEISDPFVQEFKDAAWALAPGGLSPVVRTAFGFHIIRRPALPDVRDIYRFGLAERLAARSDSVLIDSLTRTRDFELASGALADARQAVQDLDAMRNSDKPLVRYRGGAFRVKDLVRWIYSLEPQVAQAVSTVPDDQLERFLRLVSQRQVLLVLAESAGVQASPEEWAAAKAQHDSAVSLLRVALRLTPDVVRDSATTPADGAKLASAHVNDYLARVVQGRAQFLLIPPFFSVVLRQHADWKVDQAGVRLALERAKSLRAARDSAAPPPTAPASPMTPATGPAPVPGKP